MREKEKHVLDLFSSGEEVYVPDHVDDLIDKRQEKQVKQRSVEHSKVRFSINYCRTVLTRFGIRFRSPKKHVLKRLTTEHDYQLYRQKKLNQRYRLDEEINAIENEMIELGFSIQQTMDFEGEKRHAEATKTIVSSPTLQSSKESKKAVNS